MLRDEGMNEFLLGQYIGHVRPYWRFNHERVGLTNDNNQDWWSTASNKQVRTFTTTFATGNQAGSNKVTSTTLEKLNEKKERRDTMYSEAIDRLINDRQAEWREVHKFVGRKGQRRISLSWGWAYERRRRRRVITLSGIANQVKEKDSKIRREEEWKSKQTCGDLKKKKRVKDEWDNSYVEGAYI
jgi:hypothetical protein